MNPVLDNMFSELSINTKLREEISGFVEAQLNRPLMERITRDLAPAMELGPAEQQEAAKQFTTFLLGVVYIAVEKLSECAFTGITNCDHAEEALLTCCKVGVEAAHAIHHGATASTILNELIKGEKLDS